MSKQKGRRTVTKAIQYLFDAGMILVDEVELGGRFRKSKDLFAGVCYKCFDNACTQHEEKYRFDGFDLVAVSTTEVWFVQVKTNNPPSQVPYKHFAKKFVNKTVKVKAMTWYDRRGWVIHTFNKNGTVTRSDYRK